MTLSAPSWSFTDGMKVSMPEGPEGIVRRSAGTRGALTGSVLLPYGFGGVLSIRCFGRLPEQGKRSLKRSPAAKVMHHGKRRSDLRLTAALAKCIDRLNANRAQMRHDKHPEWDMQIGPGVVESAHGRMIGLRLKRPGSHWGIGDANAVPDRRSRGNGPGCSPLPVCLACHSAASRSRCGGIRREAGIGDVRLHDLRHDHASHAVMNGVPVPSVPRLPGRSGGGVTLRRVHMDGRDIRVGEAIATFTATGTDPG